MDKRHIALRDIFFDVFQRHGLKKYDSVPLITKDKTVYFTCATITPLKDFILNENIAVDGLYIHQPCLRLNSLTDNFDEKNVPSFPGYFNMLGTLIQAKYILPFQKSIIECFQLLGVSKDTIKIYAPSSKVDLVSYLSKVYTVEFDSKKDSYYDWKYGLGNDINGIGATFSLRQKDGHFEDIGQYVCIFNKNEPIACEFGFGIETFLSRHLQYGNYYEAYSIAPVLKENNLESNFINVNTFGIVAGAYSTGINLDNCPNKGYKKILNRILANIVILKKKESILDEQMASILYKFGEIEFNNTSFVPSLLYDINKKSEELLLSLQRLADFEENQLRLNICTQNIIDREKVLYPFAIKYRDIIGE